MTDVVTQNQISAWLRAFADLVAENASYLTELDSAIGDADHGANLNRGMKAAVGVLDSGEFATIDALVKKVGMTLVSTVGGASGPLYGTFFLRFATAAAGRSELSAEEFGAALRAGVGGIVQRGKAEAGDKTMLDAWFPACDAYEDAAAEGPAAAIAAASAAADRGRDATEPLVARKGRASYLGDRSAGHLDPGATSTALLLRAAASAIA